MGSSLFYARHFSIKDNLYLHSIFLLEIAETILRWYASALALVVKSKVSSYRTTMSLLQCLACEPLIPCSGMPMLEGSSLLHSAIFTVRSNGFRPVHIGTNIQHAGLMTVALMGVWLGAYNVLMKKYTLENFLELSAKIQATALRILPTIAVAISKQASFDLSRLSSVRFIMCSGAALPTPIIKFFRDSFPYSPIIQGYGMTETNITMLKAESAHRIGSVGKLFANIEARIVDDNGKDVAEDEQGEILVRGPNIFRRYMRNEEATRDTFDGEWMRTGDVGRVDAEGYFFLTERKKELIKYKG